MTIEQEGADIFFGEPEFDVDDMLRTTPDGAGVISLLEVADVMDKPRLYSTFVLWMLAQLYEQLPEVGDLPKPKLAFFFDEAHLLFDDASKALLDEIERTARLIRSKGVGVYFVTQAPTDVPSPVLSQLGNRVQHALRAFTPDDADALRKTARTFPMTDHYDVERTITSLGIGEAFVTVLSPKGVPDPARRHAADPAGFPHGPDDARGDRRGRGRVAARRQVRADGRPRERPRDHHGPPPGRAMRPPRNAAAQATMRGQVSPTTSDGLGTMTPAQQQREISRRARELEAARKAAERERKAQERAAAAAERERQRTMQTTIRTVGRVVDSRGDAVAHPGRVQHDLRRRQR